MGARQIAVRYLLLSGVIAGPVQAADPPPPAYQLAAYAAGVPSSVLYAVALQESGTRLPGKRMQPWPWTLNVAGEGFRFRNRKAACFALRLAIDAVGAKRVDAGLGQVNLGWNGHHFSRPCEALDPYRNLAVAARLLRTHYDVSGDWLAAAGRYHRPAGGAPARDFPNTWPGC